MEKHRERIGSPQTNKGFWRFYLETIGNDIQRIPGNGCFPDIWKLANVNTIFKSGPKMMQTITGQSL